MRKILKIRGTSAEITFELEDAVIRGSGEFIAQEGEIAGFLVACASLKDENGRWLSKAEQQELIACYEEYRKEPNGLRNWRLRFDIEE